MTSQEINDIIDLTRKFDANALLTLIKKNYGENIDMENIRFSVLSLSQFYGLSIKITEQFNQSFEEIGHLLPMSFVHPQYGSSAVINQLQSFLANTAEGSSNIGAAEIPLLWLALYQLSFGFYNNSDEKSLSDLIERNNQLTSKLLISGESINNQKTIVNNIRTDIEEIKKDIQQFTTQKHEELNQIKDNLSSATNQTSEINRLLTDATKVNEQIISLLNIQEENKTRLEKIISEFQIQYTTSGEIIASNSKNIEEKISQFNIYAEQNKEHLKFVEDKKTFFEERINYLQELIGREVGASLFETFKQRKVELKWSVITWAILVFAMSTITVTWIVYLFSNLNGELSDSSDISTALWWGGFAISSLKSLPAIILLLFTISQYRRERNFKEEYAFKSAVALTIDAYASRLKIDDNKDKLIMDAVFNIYKTPISEEQQKIKMKKMLEVVKTLGETAQSFTKKE